MAKLYPRGADQGDARAALKLGLLLSNQAIDGYGLPVKWFIKGCSLGDVVACHNAGVGQEYPQHGLAQNDPAAARYYRVAAERGYMPRPSTTWAASIPIATFMASARRVSTRPSASNTMQLNHPFGPINLHAPLHDRQNLV